MEAILIKMVGNCEALLLVKHEKDYSDDWDKAFVFTNQLRQKLGVMFGDLGQQVVEKYHFMHLLVFV